MLWIFEGGPEDVGVAGSGVVIAERFVSIARLGGKIETQIKVAIYAHGGEDVGKACPLLIGIYVPFDERHFINFFPYKVNDSLCFLEVRDTLRVPRGDGGRVGVLRRVLPGNFSDYVC